MKSNKKYIIKKIGKYKIKLRNNNLNVQDIDIYKEIIVENVYNFKKINLASESVIIDIGAHIGISTLELLNSFSNTKQIYAVEAHTKNYRLLKENIRLNKLESKICPFNIAINGKNGLINLGVDKYNTGAHSIFLNSTYKQAIKSVKLESFINDNRIEKVDLLLIDCEGAEFEILNNLSLGVANRIQRIIGELHIRNDMSKKYSKLLFSSILRKYGFKIKYIKKVYYKDEGTFYIFNAFNKNTTGVNNNKIDLD